MRFIQGNELKLTQVELLSFFYFKIILWDNYLKPGYQFFKIRILKNDKYKTGFKILIFLKKEKKIRRMKKSQKIPKLGVI